MGEILKREDVKKENTWALEDIYASDDLWEKELDELNKLCNELPKFEGHLTESADTLYNYFKEVEKAQLAIERIYIYANQALHVDMNNSKYQDFASRATSAMIKLNSHTAFATPEKNPKILNPISNSIKSNASKPCFFPVIILSSTSEMFSSFLCTLFIINLLDNYVYIFYQTLF